MIIDRGMCSGARKDVEHLLMMCGEFERNR